MKFSIIKLSLLFAFNGAVANVQPNSLFTNHMVLQKGVEVPVWGTADEGEKVSVSFNGQKVSTTTINGKWMVKLAPMQYVLKGTPMIISGKNSLTIDDVLVGEVWLCSGQSNMERQLGPRKPQPLITDWEKERAEAIDYPSIRSYKVPLNYSKEPIHDANSTWEVCSPKSVVEFSAVGYFMAKNLYKDLKVPIGIVYSAYGGTPAEDWTSKKALESNPKLEFFVRNYDSIRNSAWHPGAQVKNGLYNGMIAPLIPMALKGVAWYQGENNQDRAKEYQIVLPNMIKNWRTDFAQGDFPFLIVQVAPYKDLIPEIRESQFLVSQQVKNTALIVTTDCGDATNIHPAHKQPVGERLALAARKLAYGENIVYSGPVYRSYKIKADKIILNFDHVKKGFLVKKSEELKGFTIAGKDKKFVPAKATVKGNQIILSNDGITTPVAGRYGWANAPEVNLYNAEGLPASPFRTDVE